MPVIRMRTHDEIEAEINRIGCARSHFGGPGERWSRGQVNTLRWVLGLEPQSPLDRFRDPRPDHLPPRAPAPPWTKAACQP